MPLNIEKIPDQAETAAAGPAGKADSPYAELRRIHEGLARHRTEDFDVPGYAGRLVARYKRLPFKEYRDALQADDLDIVERNANFLIAALDSLWFRDEDGKMTALPASFEGVGAGWPDLAHALDIESDTAVRQVIDVFDGNEHVLNMHALTVDEWMTSVQEDADREAAGG